MADLAGRYAEALLKAAVRDGALQVVSDEMRFLAREFSQSADVFYTPLFTPREQLATVDYVLGDNFHPLTKRFIRLLADMERLGGIKKIAGAFDRLARKEMGRVDLNLTVYEEAPPEMTSKLVQAACIKGMFGQRDSGDIDLNVSVDKSLLGGFIAECEGIGWDCSLRSRLVDMSKAIRKI